MSNNLDDFRSGLPRVIALARHNPNRREFSTNGFDPRSVVSVTDLPPYLILGDLDESRCQFSASGWRARWCTLENDTHFDVTYKVQEHRYEIGQTWRGVNGGLAVYDARLPLSLVIAQGLYHEFPVGWDSRAKDLLEGRYQLSYVGHQKGWASICSIPDGASRVIAFPVAAGGLRSVLEGLSAELDLPYPFRAYARLIVQGVNYLEGRAPAWTRDPLELSRCAIADTGFRPLIFPERGKGTDGSVAWTLLRELYVVFIDVYFAGLADMLERLRSPDSYLRYRDDPARRFDLQPVVYPLGLGDQVKSMSFRDREGSTRCFWTMQRTDGPDSVNQMKEAYEGYDLASSRITTVESISGRHLAHSL